MPLFVLHAVPCRLDGMYSVEQDASKPCRFALEDASWALGSLQVSAEVRWSRHQRTNFFPAVAELAAAIPTCLGMGPKA